MPKQEKHRKAVFCCEFTRMGKVKHYKVYKKGHGLTKKSKKCSYNLLKMSIMDEFELNSTSGPKGPDGVPPFEKE